MESVNDCAYDIINCVYLFNELPPEARAEAAKEIFRVLKPGGIVCFSDSIQKYDRSGVPLLDHFGEEYNLPHFKSYLDTDLNQLFFDAGFMPGLTSPIIACQSKVLSWVKPTATDDPTSIKQL